MGFSLSFCFQRCCSQDNGVLLWVNSFKFSLKGLAYATTGANMSDFTLPWVVNSSITVDNSPMCLLVLVSNSHLGEVTGMILVPGFVCFFF